MNKTKLGIFIALILSIGIISAGMVSAKGAEITQVKVLDLGKEARLPNQANSLANEENRMIVQTTSGIDKLIFRLKGCKILHELNDATAIKCPKGLAIKGARPDRIFHMHDLEADVQINADDVWNIEGYDGTGVKVAILDTGVDDTHIELSDSVTTTKSFVRGLATDKDGHGTHVSGIVTANGIYEITNGYGYTSPNRATGVAPGAEIIVGKVCGRFGCYDSDIMAGIEWAVAQGADVLSLSLGGGNFVGHCDGDPLAAKVNWAVDEGLVVTVSAGNDGAGVSSPACASKAIAVGAVDKADIVASWSNYGPALDIVAPGVNILSTYSCVAAGDCGSYWYVWMSGTSMSAPHVAGTVALILQKNPDYTVDDVKDALYSTAVDLGAAGHDQYYGHGRVDALGAINYVKGCTEDANCDDGLYCNGAETCRAGVCQPGTPIDCLDGVACTVDSCDEDNDECVYAPNDAFCDNNVFCDGAETCDVTLGCQLGIAINCDDGNECTDESCDATEDGCIYTPVTDETSCAENSGICCSGECIVAACSLDTDCDDGNACTIDSCRDSNTCAAQCTYTSITVCSGGDGCCPAGCTSETDTDCQETDPCLNCLKGVCDGRCHPWREGVTCPDCL